MRFSEPERRVFARRPATPVSVWASRHVIMPDGPFAGARYRMDVNPYLTGIMDCWGERWTKEVLVCGAPQIGKTALLDSCLCYAIANRPGPRMLAMPDDDTLGRMAQAKLLPMFRLTRPVREVLEKQRSGRFLFSDGTSLYLASAASPAQRASISVQDLFMDEEALFAPGTRGDPVTDFLERTRSYAWKSKVLRISKPVGDESCTIWADLARMDEVRRYRVCCPACGTEQEMKLEHIIVENQVRQPQRVRREKLGRYRCPHCRWHWNDHNRDVAVARGRWLADEPVTRPRRVGFLLPAWLSAMVSLSEIAAQRLELENTDDARAHQAFANGVCAEPYTPVLQKGAPEQVLELIDKDLPPRVVPSGYRAVTMGIDMQRTGFWYLACAWTGRLDCAVIDYGRLLDWAEVHELIFEREYPVQGSDETVTAWRAALDTGGTTSAEIEGVSRTEEAYDFLVRVGAAGVAYGTKGASRRMITPVQRSILEKMPGKRSLIVGGLPLYILDTHYFKTWAASRMRKDSRQALRLHSQCEESLAIQLTAEQMVLDHGRRVWKAIRKDNHYFDCLCMALATVHAAWTPGLQRIIGEEEEA